jgi:DNA-binding transcriptional LysR family regulator
MSPPLDQLASIAVFVRVVELRSFTAAAVRLGISKSHASACVARLEQDLGTRLLHRTTRRVVPSEDGQALYDTCAPLILAAEGAVSSTSERAAEPSGTLHVSAPLLFAQLHLVPLIAEFLAEQPKLRVELHATDRVVDLVGDRIDVALRISESRQPGLIARKLGTDRSVACASPAYLRARGTPRHPRELVDHDCLRYTNKRPAEEWRFRIGNVDESIQVRSPFGAGDAITLREAARAGIGIAALPETMIEPELKSGALVEVLADFPLPALGIYAVYPERTHLPQKVRAFLDFFSSRWKRRALHAA